MSQTSLPTRFHAFKLSPERLWGGMEPLADAVKHAEEAGYDAINCSDHVILPRQMSEKLPDDLYYDKSVLGAYLAAHTKRIKIFFFVMVIPYHPPLQAAKALATLDQVSNGRVILGTGVGNLEREFEMLGVPFHERGAITNEYLRVMKRLWTEENPSYHGKYINFEDAIFTPKCVQRPHIPIWIGGNGPAAIRRAVELGDGFVPRSGSLQTVEREANLIKEGLAKARRDPQQFDFCYSLGVTERPTGTAGSSYPSYPFDAGAVIEGVEGLRAAGFNNVYVRFDFKTPTELKRQMDWFAAKVMPAFKRA